MGTVRGGKKWDGNCPGWQKDGRGIVQDGKKDGRGIVRGGQKMGGKLSRVAKRLKWNCPGG